MFRFCHFLHQFRMPSTHVTRREIRCHVGDLGGATSEEEQRRCWRVARLVGPSGGSNEKLHSGKGLRISTTASSTGHGVLQTRHERKLFGRMKEWKIENEGDVRCSNWCSFSQACVISKERIRSPQTVAKKNFANILTVFCCTFCLQTRLPSDCCKIRSCHHRVVSEFAFFCPKGQNIAWFFSGCIKYFVDLPDSFCFNMFQRQTPAFKVRPQQTWMLGSRRLLQWIWFVRHDTDLEVQRLTKQGTHVWLVWCDFPPFYLRRMITSRTDMQQTNHLESICEKR